MDILPSSIAVLLFFLPINLRKCVTTQPECTRLLNLLNMYMLHHVGYVMLCYVGFKQECLLLNFVSERSLRMKKYPIFCFLVGANIWVWCVIQVGKINEVSPCYGFHSKLRSPPIPDTFFPAKGCPRPFGSGGLCHKQDTGEFLACVQQSSKMQLDRDAAPPHAPLKGQRLQYHQH